MVPPTVMRFSPAAGGEATGGGGIAPAAAAEAWTSVSGGIWKRSAVRTGLAIVRPLGGAPMRGAEMATGPQSRNRRRISGVATPTGPGR